MSANDHDAGMIERRHPIVAVDIDRVRDLLEPTGVALDIRSLDLLVGGHVNTNYRITAHNGERFVLRIWTRGEEVFHHEIDALDRARGAVPVPAVCASAYLPQLFPYPYAIMEWVTGESLSVVLTQEPGAAAAIGEAVADILDRLGKLVPPSDMEPPFREFIHACLFEHGAAARLGKAMTSNLWRAVCDHAALVDDYAGDPRFVHGDFQGDNLLVRRAGTGWSIAAVLDWEWARKGSILSDLGSLLRREGVTAFIRGLETELAVRGQALPSGWETAAKLKDLTAQCEKLTFPRHRGEVTERTIRTIARYLSELAMPARP